MLCWFIRRVSINECCEYRTTLEPHKWLPCQYIWMISCLALGEWRDTLWEVAVMLSHKGFYQQSAFQAALVFRFLKQTFFPRSPSLKSSTGKLAKPTGGSFSSSDCGKLREPHLAPPILLKLLWSVPKMPVIFVLEPSKKSRLRLKKKCPPRDTLDQGFWYRRAWMGFLYIRCLPQSQATSNGRGSLSPSSLYYMRMLGACSQFPHGAE